MLTGRRAPESSVTVLLHLSDLHLLADRPEQPAVLEALVDAVAADRAQRGRSVDLLCVTGDVFDSATVDPRRAVGAFLRLLRALRHALGAPVPAVVVPGNHDRRVGGVVGPHRRELFDHLADAVPRDVFVHGASGPFLSAVVPPALHGQPLWLVAYDSTWLPQGLLGAGGTLRQEDLLHAAAAIGAREPDWPVVLLLHHHLVPTPITDYDVIDAEHRSRFVRWGVRSLLPRLVANADREEWMMTALGAGTALSTLQTLGRACLVLHGHKHNATARVFDATVEGQGDVVVASAGSAGTAAPVRQADTRRAARVWPSFNVVELDEGALSIETVAFGWKGRSRGALDGWPLVWAARAGSQWRVVPTPVATRDHGPRLARDEARARLLPSRRVGRWDVHWERRLVPDLEARMPHYVETLSALPEAEVVVGGEPVETPHDLGLGFEPVRYHVTGGALRSSEEARRTLGPAASPFGSLELLVRYRCGEARLVIDAPGGPGGVEEVFASATDVGSGLERPVPVEREGELLVVALRPCPARTLLRLYWTLEERDPARSSSGAHAALTPRRGEAVGSPRPASSPGAAPSSGPGASRRGGSRSADGSPGPGPG